ncbi:MAG TPA: MATE family efflux transporter [Candidatus Sulfotelmatobacter sp.]|nr:MATE family efflux transporter [Candidatus Sulfotelmatobacter sp.]
MTEFSAPAAVPNAPLPEAVTRPIPSMLLRLALPVLASQALRLAYQWVDAIWVRGLGVSATAAVTSSIFVMWSVYSLNDIFAIGVTAYVSQLMGAGNRDRAGVAAWKGLRSSFLLGLVGTAAGLFAARRLFQLMGGDAAIVDSGGRYLSVVLTAAPLPMLGLTCESIMRASGDTRTPLLIDLGAVLLNAALSPLLIYGVGPFPRLGVAGAGWATVIAQAVMVTSYLTLAARGHRAFPLRRHAEGAPVRIRGLARVGLPACLIGLLFAVVYIAFARSASRFGAASMAVVGIANRVEAFEFVVSVAIGSAGAALVGQNLGARRPDRAMEVWRTGLKWSGGFALALTAVYLLFPRLLLGIFTRDPGVLRVGVPYVRVLSLCFVAAGVEIVTGESLLGSGHTREISAIYTVFSLIRIPLAFWLPDWTGTGAIGVAWLITSTCILRAIVLVGWAARGTWKRGLHRELG